MKDYQGAVVYNETSTKYLSSISQTISFLKKYQV
jgi:hypothetical protein